MYPLWIEKIPIFVLSAGKTYLGIQIARLLVHNLKKCARLGKAHPTHQFAPMRSHEHRPILCLCYTNHALDQFLMGLIESGIKSVVRVGGKIRRDELKEYDIKNIRRKHSQGIEEYVKDIKDLGSDLDMSSEKIQRLFRWATRSFKQFTV